jgi:uncharacterized tellurite resistance protein B-like protein
MIIWGSRGITSVLEEGQFHCPQCVGTRPFRLKQVRNFFTLYFIPVIPLTVLGRYLQCGSCAGTFSEEMKEFDPKKNQQEAETDMLRVMVLAALADGVVDDNERSAIKRQYLAMVGLPVTEAILEKEIQLAISSGTTLNQFLGNRSGQYNSQGKGLIVKFVFETMVANGALKPAQQKALASLASTLGIPEDQYRALIEHISSQSE